MEDIEIPEYFICPISLQIMRDPVTIITGITYDRDSIEQWLFTHQNTICPVTKQSLSKDFDLTPNHTLRRLIQSWCLDNSSRGFDIIPSPKPLLDRYHLLKLEKDLHLPHQQMKTLVALEVLAAENDRNRKFMAGNGVYKALLLFIVSCFKKGQIDGIQQAVSILRLIRIPCKESKTVLTENDQIIDSFTWVLGLNTDSHMTVKSHAVYIVKKMFEDASSSLLERLKPEFFQRIIGVIREKKISQQGIIISALKVLLCACPRGRNRIMMVEEGAVFELIDLELRSSMEKNITEVIMGILCHLCSSADGREKLLNHKAGIALVAQRILKISAMVDDHAVSILGLICKFSGTAMVIQEMLSVNAVSKLFLVIQADCCVYLKDKAKEILRTHSEQWKNSPCIDASPLTR